jgi:hypothetical protein
MNRVYQAGNMPKNVAVFARQLTGSMSGQKETEFWEMSSIDEFEKNASQIGYEIVPAMDMSTKRGYLVGFDVEDSVIVGINEQYSQLKMYFIEVTEAEFNTWVAKMKKHREMQQEDYYIRKAQKEAGLKHLKVTEGDQK